MRLLGRLLLLVAMAGAPAATAQTPPAPTPPAPTPPAAESSADRAAASVTEQAVSSKGAVTIGGKRVDYVATPGTLTIRDDEGNPVASMFYVAYTVPEAGGARARPVTFLFNGGPGSSSIWLHMGSFGPVRVDTPTTEVAKSPPFRVVSNSSSMLDRTDLVFLDAIGTGYSRTLGKAVPKDFWGDDPDMSVFARGIERYLTINDRWNSPKFIFGESYGTYRAAGLAYLLQDRGVQLSGVVLMSTILNYGVRSPMNDMLYVTLLPSYAATAWYHHRIPNRPETLEPYLTEVRNFALGPYLSALAKGSDLPDAERDTIARQLSAYTGISVEVLLDNDLRLGLQRFRKELLRDKRRTVGRLDSRFTGIDLDGGGEAPEFDAQSTAIGGAYLAALNSHVTGTLGYKTGLVYRSGDHTMNSWDRSHRVPSGGRPIPFASTAVDLSQAMRENPHLKVLQLGSYYDLATTFFGAEYDLKHMQLDPELRKNLSFAYYESGHMVYVHPDSLVKLKRDLDAFYAEATAP